MDATSKCASSEALEPGLVGQSMQSENVKGKRRERVAKERERKAATSTAIFVSEDHTAPRCGCFCSRTAAAKDWDAFSAALKLKRTLFLREKGADESVACLRPGQTRRSLSPLKGFLEFIS